MSYFCLSFTHKNTALDVRERLALDDTRIHELLKLILANSQILECVLLSTCNRTELMCYLEDEALGVNDYLLKCLCLVCKIEFDLIKNSPDLYEDSGFIHHLFSVASSLDSLVIGETQIVSQLKNAFNKATKYYQAPRLKIAFDSAFKCAAKVRNETQISKHKLSISSVAVDDAATKCDLASAKILIIGSGEMARLCAKHLNRPCVITSRTYENAIKLANEIENASAMHINELENCINSFDLIFSATSNQTAFLSADMFDSSKRLIYDIAVPRDTAFNVHLNTQVICVDDLKQIISTNMQLKEEQAKLAYKIVAAAVREFFAKEQELAATPIIKAIREHAEHQCIKQLKIAEKKGYLKHSDLAEVKRYSKQLLNAFLHDSTIRLKNADGYDCEVLKYIFDVKESNETN